MFKKIKPTYLSLKIVNLAVKKFYTFGRGLDGFFKLIKISSKGYMTHILAPRHSAEQHLSERHSTERTALTNSLLSIVAVSNTIVLIVVLLNVNWLIAVAAKIFI